MFSKSAHSFSLFVLLMLAHVWMPSEVRAQTSSNHEVAVAPEGASATGPRVLSATTMWGLQADAPRSAAPQSSPNVGKDVAMMGVGAAGIVVGSLVGGSGGTMIAISGGVIGLVGLYRYLR